MARPDRKERKRRDDYFRCQGFLLKRGLSRDLNKIRFRAVHITFLPGLDFGTCSGPQMLVEIVSTCVVSFRL